MKIAPILSAASEAFEVPASDIRSLSRKPHIVAARHAVMFLAREYGAPWSQVSDFFRMDPSSARTGAGRASERLATDPDFCAAITETRANLEAAQ